MGNTTTSYYMNSILSSKEIIDLGAIWNVGKGDKIHIWNDPWLLWLRKPTSVKYLIDPKFYMD